MSNLFTPAVLTTGALVASALGGAVLLVARDEPLRTALAGFAGDAKLRATAFTAGRMLRDESMEALDRHGVKPAAAAAARLAADDLRRKLFPGR